MKNEFIEILKTTIDTPNRTDHFSSKLLEEACQAALTLDNIVEAIGKIEKRDLPKVGPDWWQEGPKGFNKCLDRINTIIKEGGGG